MRGMFYSGMVVAQFVTPPGTVLGQFQVVRVPSEPSCTACSIVLRHVATLRGDDGGGLEGWPGWMTRGPDGRLYVVHADRRVPVVFEPDGKFAGQLGRRGAGPGEFLDARIVLVSPDNRVHILDPALNRQTIFADGGARLIETTNLAGASIALKNAVLVPGGHIVMNREQTGAATVGFALQEITRQGEIARLFDEESLQVPNSGNMRRLLFARANREIWSGHPFAYEIQLFSRDRNATKRIVRDAEWFKPLPVGGVPSGGLFDEPPSTIVMALWEDSNGLLWTATTVPAVDWKPGPSVAEWRAGGMRPVAPPNKPLNSVIEVLDPAAGRLIASLRVPEWVVYALGADLVASYREDANGMPFVDIWQVNLNRSR